MARGLRHRLLEAPDPPVDQPVDWPQAEAMARKLPEKTNLVVPKRLLAADPPYARSRLGRSRGALRQFRCLSAKGNLHVKEFERHWVLHVDAFHPARHPLRHLAVDHGFRTFLHLHEVLALFAPKPAPTPTPTAG